MASEFHNPQHYMHGDERLAVRPNLITLGERAPGFPRRRLAASQNQSGHNSQNKHNQSWAGNQPKFPSLPPHSFFLFTEVTPTNSLTQVYTNFIVFYSRLHVSVTRWPSSGRISNFQEHILTCSSPYKNLCWHVITFCLHVFIQGWLKSSYF
jgi:hypothetical protein